MLGLIAVVFSAAYYAAPERITRLKPLDTAWHVQDAAWERGHDAAARYAAAHGSPGCPTKYIDPDGFKLGW